MRGARSLAFVVSLLASRAAAEPPLHFTTPSKVITQKGTNLDLPPGYYLSEPQWDKLDLEVKRLQTQETRLKAENKSLKSSSSNTWLVLGLVVGAFAGGIGLGFAIR